MDTELGYSGKNVVTATANHSSSFDNGESSSRGGFGGFVDSFRPAQSFAYVKPDGKITTDSDADSADVQQADQLSQGLKSRHLQMIAIGGSIGTGLFVSSGAALAAGGPGSVVIGFGLVGIMIYCTVQALGELAVQFPIAGSFAAHASRFVDPAWGFAMGWNYALLWLVSLPLEIIAASITIGFWDGASNINPTVWVTIFFVAITVINLFGVKGYGEAEFVFSIIKVIAVIGFIILGIIIDCGGVPTDNRGYLGARTWYEPGAFNNGFKGLCSVFITAAFSFSGTELVGLAAAETRNPRIELPKAIKQVFWRILLFYMVSLTIAGLLVPYDDPRLLGSSSTDANASPFVIAIRDASIAGLPSVMNAVILIAVLSVGNSSIYASSRTLAALAEQGQAPKSFGYIDRAGRPLVSILVSSAFGLLCFVVAAGDNAQSVAFTWMLAISGLSLILAWLSTCLCHIRFRAAWKAQGRRLDELAFKSQTGVVGSYIGLIFNCLVLVAQFWIGAWPVGYEDMTVGEQVLSFFQAYLAAPVVIMFYVVFKIWKRTSIQRAATIDITTGTREIDLPRILEEERIERQTWPAWKRWYRFFC
ncbi:hypothetical protein MBLNU13_g00746t1 [Cladosporium sp. NU13]